MSRHILVADTIKITEKNGNTFNISSEVFNTIVSKYFDATKREFAGKRGYAWLKKIKSFYEMVNHQPYWVLAVLEDEYDRPLKSWQFNFRERKTGKGISELLDDDKG